MPCKAHMIAIMLSTAVLSVLILLAIPIANAWLHAEPIVDMRL